MVVGAARLGCHDLALGTGTGGRAVAIAVPWCGGSNIFPQTTMMLGFAVAAAPEGSGSNCWGDREGRCRGVAEPPDITPKVLHRRKRRRRGMREREVLGGSYVVRARK
jgi:hypothetical protein